MRDRGTSRGGLRPAILLLAATAVMAATGVARAQTSITCPQIVPTELKEPPVIPAVGGRIDTTFRIQLQQLCVPQAQSDGTVKNVPMELRTYVYPDPDKPGQWRSGFPGPTLKLRKPSTPTGRGDSLAINLVNELPPDGGHTCDSACPASTVCPDRSKLPDPTKCGTSLDPLCCCWVNVNQTYPDCFHGDNTTNLHFHGSHVSPQPPQDYVLLELAPRATAAAALHPMNPRGSAVAGEYQYRVDPLPYTQPDGTHWYHPHKHGSVGLQVANGMAGTLLIEGPFDDWLRGYYDNKLVEKLLVIQQISQNTNLYNAKAAPPPLLINGQVSPTVTMRPGEVQRWRFVNATMQASAQVSLQFPANVQVRQIAMDGIQFSPQNYAGQPLFIPTYPNVFKISPGNRVDFLVQAPAAAGSFTVRQRVFGNVAERTERQLRLRARAVTALAAPESQLLAAAEQTGTSPIFTLVVAAEPPAGGKNRAAVAQGFPPASQWPPLPPYLRDITPGEIVPPAVVEDFQMSSGPGNPATIFTINGIQYDNRCVNVTTAVDTAREWTVYNSSPLLHPFHVHTNPFQLMEQGTVIGGKPVAFVKYASPVWQDTVALPVVNSSWDVSAGPLYNNADAQAKCPGVCKAASGGTWSGQWATTVPGVNSVCGCKYTGNGYVKLRHRYTEFTGEYVLHCHFLGHEDRGMMFGVQTVCRNNPSSFGKARTGGQPECVAGNYIPAAPQCPVTAHAAGAGPLGGDEAAGILAVSEGGGEVEALVTDGDFLDDGPPDGPF